MSFSLAHIRDALRVYSPRDFSGGEALARAAVAIVLREEEATGETGVLMIRRAEHPDDPWSGHMGFPGGRVEERDASPERAAVRETEEELGLSLDTRARLLGRLSELQARSRFKLLPLAICPMLYELIEPAEFQLNHEIVEWHWIPLSFFLIAENRVTMEHPLDRARTLPCYRLGERVIWGLSLSMLDELLADVLRSEIPSRAA